VESTANLVTNAIELQPLGSQVLKGKEVPVKAFRAIRVVAQRGGRGRTEGLEPPFTGRHDELRLLKDQLHATTRESRARLVSIVGDAGIGKSRLAWELTKYIDGISDTVYWHQGRSPAYGDGIAFWAIGEMIRGRAGIVSEGDDRAKSRMKLRTAIAEYVPLEEERRWVEPGSPPFSASRRHHPRPQRTVRCHPHLLQRIAERSRSSWSSRTCTGPTTGCSSSSRI
jgi:hypothetical protein